MFSYSQSKASTYAAVHSWNITNKVTNGNNQINTNMLYLNR